MKKYMVIYMAPPAMIAELMKMPPEMAKKGMDEWNGWMRNASGSLVDRGSVLGKSKRVSPSDAMDVKNDITGYSVVQADSLDAAAAMLKDHPHLKMGMGATIEVVEFFDLPGM